MKILLPYHLGCGNRGCEGIARGTANLLKLKKEDMILFDVSPYDFEADTRIGLDDVGLLKYTKQNKPVELARLAGRALQKIKVNGFYEQVMSDYYIGCASPGDAIFITGGDIYCYEQAASLPNLIVKKAKKKGIKTVLFGVSMEKKFLTNDVVSGLRNYDIITTRETISSKTLNDLGLKNYLYPDPAFSLKPVVCDLPDYFSKPVVGINFSPFTDTSPLFESNMVSLIEYILSEGMDICFIPHVFWKDQDDRKSIKKYVEKNDDCIHILDSESMSYLQIRYAISKCKYFLGGRTHSVISAYSTHTPCIALGYSVKSKGVAKDIGMPEYTVIDSKHLMEKNELLNAFIKLEDNYELIMRIYDQMDSYVSKFNGLQDLILG